MNTMIQTFKKLIALSALGILVTACAPQSAFSNLDYSNAGTSSTVSPSSITKMGYGF
jgi:hypothetical protein